ncbi:response regulator receiver protein [Rubidibacter lacunae KORDI 51-2]|uniref:Response regulator receiver protein n=1 Tax=Rubidibacter lacunae KORDI 51-2 TaxID=582515 RepID=U5DJ88_9CHRO|nr:response regulator [Rubidibacter lacunae]ERN41756.1 response regulator receiver protein [Rubidibacter lacunae KORDI 51-2]
MSNDAIAPTTLDILVVDDHEMMLDGTVGALQAAYPDATLRRAQTTTAAREQLTAAEPNLAVVDLSLPKTPDDTSQVDNGLELLRSLLQDFPQLNLAVQSTYVKVLVRLKHEIDAHQGGFTVIDKSLSKDDMLLRIGWALQGLTHTKDIRAMQAGLEVKPEWLDVLTFAFQEGLQDKAIAARMHVSERLVRHYWTKLQDALDIYPEDSKKDGKNLRIITEIRAREEGLIN